MALLRVNENRAFRVIFSILMIIVLMIIVARPARAAVGVSSILIPSVIAALESWGISTDVSGLDGQEIAQWFHDKLTDWSTYVGIALENIVTGIKMTPLGQVLLNPVASMAIKDFAGWFVQQNGLTSGGSPVQVISSSLTLNGYPVWVNASYESSVLHKRFDYSAHDCYLFICLNDSNLQLYAVSLTSGGFVHEDTYTNGSLSNSRDVSVSRQLNGCYYFLLANQPISLYETYSPPAQSYTINDITAASGGVQSGDGTMSLVPADTLDVPTTSDLQDKEILIDAGLNVGADAAAWYDSVMQKVAANDMTVTGTITQAGTITADQVLDQGAIREEDGVVVWPDVVQPIGVTGLDDIFPFCIPFDIYHFCQALAADPVAPSFDVPFVIPGIVDYTFHLDLEDFDQVAALLRTLELLLFCVGLAFVTRSMFIRG